MDFGKLNHDIPRSEFDALQMDKAMNEKSEGKLIKAYIEEHKKFREMVQQANRYFIGYNDILMEDKGERIDRKVEEQMTNPLRSADNKEPHGFYPILVEQKIAYGFADQIIFKSKNKKYNKHLVELSNLLYTKIDYLALYSSNGGFSWLYHYIDKQGNFCIEAYESCEIIPLYDYLEGKKLKYVIRYFGDTAILYSLTKIKYYNVGIDGFYTPTIIDGKEKESVYFYKINVGKIKVGGSYEQLPFIRFNNNMAAISDLTKIKPFIDAYDMIVSNYVNDVEDLQQLIFILINYGGQNLTEFLQDLRKYKAIKVKKTKDGQQGGVETLKVEIPVEARTKLLEIIEENIWNIGQGVNPKLFKNAGNLSSVGIQELYGLLELKTSLMIMQYRDSIIQLINAHKSYLKMKKLGDYTNESVEQVYTRTMIKNDKENIENCKNSVGITSLKTILANHPFVTNVDEELEQIKREEQEEEEYNNFFNNDDVSKKIKEEKENE